MICLLSKQHWTAIFAAQCCGNGLNTNFIYGRD